MKAITVGSATIDVIASIRDDDIERMTLHNVTESFLLLAPGHKVDAESISTHIGGGAVNAAVSLVRQGFDVSALVKVGNDLNARKLLERFAEEGISTELVRQHDQESTAVSVLISSHDRNAAIFTHRGANGYLLEDDIKKSAFEDAGLVYVTNLSNDSADRFPSIVRNAKAAGAFVAVNPGIRQLTSKTEALFDHMENINLFQCNFEEARALVPALVHRTGWEKKGSTRQSDQVLHGIPTLAIEGFTLEIDDFAKRIHALGVDIVGITNGSDGAYISVVRDGDIGNATLHIQPVVNTTVKGTVGAGDAFASTLAGCLSRGMDVASAANLAARNAASVVAALDAQSGLMTLAELEQRD